MESPKVGISERISARAKEVGIRQVDVVKHTEATKATVSRWFNFDVEPDAKREGGGGCQKRDVPHD